MFGTHLTLDIQEVNFGLTTNYEYIYEMLNKMPEYLGMTKMELPHVVKWLDKGAKIPGISGFVMIAESHISIHTFPQMNYVFMDIFSCKPFDVEKTIQMVKTMFKVTQSKIASNTIKRGLTFPRAKEDSLYA